MVTGVQEEVPFCSPGTSSNKRGRAPQVGHDFAFKTRMRQLKQTRFCWPFSNWQVTVNLPISRTTLTEYRKSPNPSLQQCLFLMKNLQKLICLKICSKQVWKTTNNSRKKTEYTKSTLSCEVMLCRRSKTSAAPAEEIWQKPWLCSVENT